jgi:hypothetical protein
MSNSYISFDLLPSDPLIPLGAEVWINQEKIGFSVPDVRNGYVPC